MSQRNEPQDSPDDFPTPPLGHTCALIEHVIGNKDQLKKMRCLEPACGAGHMALPLMKYFFDVVAADAYDYGFGQTRDFLKRSYPAVSIDWIITNPPFRLAEEFILHALPIASIGVAILARSVFLESDGRYQRIFKNMPPSKFAQFVERVPMVRGRLDLKASTATSYAWFCVGKSKMAGHLV